MIGNWPLNPRHIRRLSKIAAEQAQADWACFGKVTIGRAIRRGEAEGVLRGHVAADVADSPIPFASL